MTTERSRNTSCVHFQKLRVVKVPLLFQNESTRGAESL